MNKYDIHSHILPGIDDGAEDVDISLVLLEELEKQGVTHLALTPHFYTQLQPLSSIVVQSFIQEREKAFNLLKDEYGGKIKLILGCELHLTNNILALNDITPFCYNGTSYMLTEMPYNSIFPPNEIELLKVIINTYNVTPVLAHIERYPVLLKNKALLCKLVEMGCMAQINTESLSKIIVGKKLIKLVNEGLVHFVGTDTHSTMRGCDYEAGFSILEKKCLEQAINTVMANSQKLFNI